MNMEIQSIAWQQAQGVAFLPASDTLYRHTPLPLRSAFSPLGVPLVVETNAPMLAERAQEVFGHWNCTDVDAGPEGIRLRLLLHDVPESLPDRIPSPLMRAQEGYFLLSLGQSLGFADREAGLAVAYITPALMAQPDLVNSCFVECLGLYLVCGCRRVPLHAAGVQWVGRGVLITGQDGAGKSTLAYACLRAGFRLLAEDIVFAPEPQLRPDPTVWGEARHLHLLADAIRLFPELRDAPFVQRMNGEVKLCVQVRDLDCRAPITRMPVQGICSVGRAAGAEARLLPADPEHLRHALTHFKGDPPLNSFDQRIAAERLLACRTAHLEVGSDLDHAVALLKRWIEQMPCI
jgi:hypothetical protein